jgi:hypothetical protein
MFYGFRMEAKLWFVHVALCRSSCVSAARLATTWRGPCLPTQTDPRRTQCGVGWMSALSRAGENARDDLVSHHTRIALAAAHYELAVGSPLSLLTFFAAAKKVSAAPHRGDANRPITTQGKAKNPKNHQNQGAAGNNGQQTKNPNKSHYLTTPLTYWSFLKNPPTIRSTKPRKKQARHKSRLQGKKSPAPAQINVRTSRGPRSETTAMPITVRQKARTCRAPSPFSGRHAGPAR